MTKFKSIFQFTGFILAGISGVAYLILLFIIINGFESNIGNTSLIVFLVVGAVDGVLINLSLRIQGIDFAKVTDEAKTVLNLYNGLKGADIETKTMPMWLFMIFNVIKDIIFKGGSIVFTLYFSITIIVEGLGDFTYMYLGIFNVLMYFGFGLLSMSKAYDHYMENEIPRIKIKYEKLKKKGVKENELFRKNEGVSSSSVWEDGGRGTTPDIERDRGGTGHDNDSASGGSSETLENERRLYFTTQENSE